MNANKLALYIDLMRLNRPIGILLLLWPTLSALWIASAGQPDWHIVMLFIMGTVCMRSAGCVINDYADRNIDPYVARTRHRPLASRRIHPTEALVLAALLSGLAFGCVLPLNRLTWLLSIPALFLAASYPWTKRFLAIPQAYLGIAFGFGIPMAFAASQNTVPWLAWLMLIANVFWSVAYDTEYAMVDKEDDLKIGIKTAAITFKQYDKAAIMLCHTLFIGLFTAVGILKSFGSYYFAGIAAAALFISYQYTLIYHREPRRCFRAFLNNHWVGLSIFSGIVAHYLFAAS